MIAPKLDAARSSPFTTEAQRHSAFHRNSTQRTSQRRESIAFIEWATQTLRSSDYRRNHHQTGLGLKVGFLRCRIGSGFEGAATELDNLEVCSANSKCDDFASFAMFLAIFAFQNTPMKQPEPMSRRPRRHRRLHPTLRVSVPLWFNPPRELQPRCATQVTLRWIQHPASA